MKKNKEAIKNIIDLNENKFEEDKKPSKKEYNQRPLINNLFFNPLLVNLKLYIIIIY